MSGYPGEDGRNGWKAIPGAVLVFSTTTASFSTTYVEDVSRQWRRRSCVGPDHSNASLASVRAFEFEGVRSIDPKKSHSRMFHVSTTFFEWCPCFEAESKEISDRAVFTRFGNFLCGKESRSGDVGPAFKNAPGDSPRKPSKSS